MSSTHSPFEEDGECQKTFDRLASSSGLEQSASDSMKLAALRNLPHERLNRLLGNKMLIRPVWDSKWFTLQDRSVPISCLARFPDRIQGLTIGWMNDEFAMFHKIWKLWSSEQLREAVTSSVLDSEMAEQILKTYGISIECQSEAVGGLVDFITDSFYAALPISLAKLEVPTSVYRFDQRDNFEGSTYQGYAYHCLDTPLLSRFPAVAGPQAPNSMRATADLLSRSLTEFTHGNQPWASYKDEEKVMLINGDQSGLVDWPNNCR
jgi:carboxylesterase type B